MSWDLSQRSGDTRHFLNLFKILILSLLTGNLLKVSIQTQLMRFIYFLTVSIDSSSENLIEVFLKPLRDDL